MSTKNGKKLGFFAALTMLIGSVVGIGIFFKSHGILRANDWNGTGTLLAWILGGLLSLAAAVSFSEIGSMKTKNVSGLPAYAEKLGGTKFGYFVRTNYTMFYMGILSVVLGFFGSEIIIGMVASWTNKGADIVPMYGHALIAFAISGTFITLNFLSVKGAGYVAQVSTILKWVPLVLVAVLGIAMATTNKHPMDSSYFDPSVGKTQFGFGYNAFDNGTSFKFTGLLAALPAVLFAYDAFLGTLSLKDKIKGGEKKLPLIVIVGMSSVVVLYTLIALACILHGSGMVSGAPFGAKPSEGAGVFDQIFNEDVAKAMGKMVIVFLAISTLGVVNGLSAMSVANFEQGVETNTIFGAKTLKAKYGVNVATYIITATVMTIWALVMYVPAVVMKSDSIIDGISNYPTLFFFAIYAIIILMYTLKRSKIDSTKINNIVYLTFAWIAIVGILLLVGYQFIYGFFIQAIMHPAATTHWGLYLGDSGADTSAFPHGLHSYMSLAQASIVMFSFAAIFVALPAVNYLLTKKLENNNPIVNTQK